MSDTSTSTTTPPAPAGAPPPDPANPPPAPPAPKADDDKDWKAEHENAVKDARKWEERAKANRAAAKELEELKRSGMSDIEKAVAQARDEGRAEAGAEFGGLLVAVELKAALTGREVADEQATALIEGLDAKKFLTDDGKPDSEAIAKWADRIAKKPTPDLGQGARGNQPAGSDMNSLIRSRMGR